MSRRLSPRAVRRLLEVAAPLRDQPDRAAVDQDRYELGAVLGQGGMGIVYAAFDKQLGRPIALKILSQPAGGSEEARQRFLREARAAARLVHPHIATVYDATPEAIAMQRVEGQTLAELEDPEPRRIVALLRDAALAIHYAHGEGIVHRDLKPANLMVDESERPHVYVMDFGLAKELAVDSTLSLTGHIVGTPSYMAPEQASGRREAVGPCSDIYGLGATLYACLAGHAPFPDTELFRLLQRVVEEEPRPLHAVVPGLSRDLSLIVGKCMAKEPAQRYATALALASDLDRWLRSEPVQVRPPSLLYRFRRLVARRQGMVLAGLVTAALVLLMALPFVIHARTKKQEAEERSQVLNEVVELSRFVTRSIEQARNSRRPGAGHEASSFAPLEQAAVRCQSFLDRYDEGQAWFLLGKTRRAQLRASEALAALNRAAELLPGSHYVLLERGLVRASQFLLRVPVLGEEPSEELRKIQAAAARDLQAALEGQELSREEMLFATGFCFWMNGELDLAIERFREVFERDSLHFDTNLALARLYALTGSDDLAMMHSVRHADFMRGNQPAYVHRDSPRPPAEVDPDQNLLAIEGLEERLIDFALVVQTDPTNAPTYGLRGQVKLRAALRCLQQGAQEAARQELLAAIREFTSALLVKPHLYAAQLDRAVGHALLARLLATTDDTRACTVGARASRNSLDSPKSPARHWIRPGATPSRRKPGASRWCLPCCSRRTEVSFFP